MGILQLFASTLDIDVPTATHAITAYTGCGDLRALLLSSQAGDIVQLIAARFVTGLAQGTYLVWVRSWPPTSSSSSAPRQGVFAVDLA